jgi:hypothetical protein
MGKYLKKSFNAADGDCWQTEYRGPCAVCGDTKASPAFDEFMYSCDCVQVIYKLYDIAGGGKDLLMHSPDKGVLGEMINAMEEFCTFEIHEINQGTGEVKISRDWYSYSI